ncbi:hypothetical protein GCM10020001_118840 [Nonomuraea salmonea]
MNGECGHVFHCQVCGRGSALEADREQGYCAQCGFAGGPLREGVARVTVTAPADVIVRAQELLRSKGVPLADEKLAPSPDGRGVQLAALLDVAAWCLGGSAGAAALAGDGHVEAAQLDRDFLRVRGHALAEEHAMTALMAGWAYGYALAMLEAGRADLARPKVEWMRVAARGVPDADRVGGG